ncbi:hypothetical protein ARMSODRAFT_977829 [Armillaria solidipes]|uniref:Ribonuclease H1 N-terminal domain-containing protein n=1 Tax=Armillaria solidipes TaxID=1076256 RepID=A0A2H3BJI7_9AGAR|nr:hypothetical protein ARMSODRAFT_977829 [Armillaria solidipes]
MAGLSPPLSSTSSFRSSSKASTHLPKKPRRHESHYLPLRDCPDTPVSGEMVSSFYKATLASEETSSISVVNELEDGYDVEVTTTITTTIWTCHSATSQPQSPTPAKPQHQSTLLCQWLSPSSTQSSTRTIKMEHSRAMSPSRVSGSASAYPLTSTPQDPPQKASGNILFGYIHYAIPHPSDIMPSPYINTPPKKWYAVTVGQHIGVFDDWLLVKELMDFIPGPRFHGYKTFCQALEHYQYLYHKGQVKCLPIAGSRWDDPIPDWDKHEFKWNEELEEVVNSIQEHHAAQWHQLDGA